MNELDALYQQIILEHAKARHGSPLAEHPAMSGESVSAQQHNPTCGDRISVRVDLDSDTVTQLAWEGEGCSISMASASVLSDLAAGMPLPELARLTEEFRELMRAKGAQVDVPEDLEDAAAFAGVSKFPARVKCAMLSWTAVEQALATRK